MLRTMHICASYMMSSFLNEVDENSIFMFNRMISRKFGKELPLLAIYCRLIPLTVREQTNGNVYFNVLKDTVF